MKFKTEPVLMSIADGEIFLATLEGCFGWSKHLNLPSIIYDSGLSRMLAIGIGENVATIGQWLPTMKTWIPNSGKAVMEIPVFTGKASALAASKDSVWVAGADIDKSHGSISKKDHVPLLEEKIMELSPSGQMVQLKTGPIGRVNHICGGKGWLLFTEKDKPGKISLIKNEKIESLSFPGGLLKATARQGDKVVLGSQKGFWNFDPTTLKFELVAKSKDDEPAPLFICICGEKIFSATSKGVFDIYNKNAIGRVGQQPYAMNCYGESLLILWPKGELEQWNTKTYMLEKSLKTLLE